MSFFDNIRELDKLLGESDNLLEILKDAKEFLNKIGEGHWGKCAQFPEPCNGCEAHRISERIGRALKTIPEK